MTERRFDFVIIGGGIVGLTVAKALLEKKCGSVLVLDKEKILGLHASGRNSGVLHAGIYYSPDSLKSKVCAAGAKLLTEYARSKDIPIEKNGKVIVASSDREATILRGLYERAQANGIRVELVDELRLREIEPEARTVGVALYSPDTAVIDSKAVLRAIEQDILAMGGNIYKDAEAHGVDEGRVTTRLGEFHFGHLVNAAGLQADRIAHQVGVGLHYKILPFKGIYKKLTPPAAARFRRSIYPAPDLSVPFLGVHLTRTVTGDVYAGPTALPALGRENYGRLKGISRECAGILLSLGRMAWSDTQGIRKMAMDEIAKCQPAKFLKSIQRLAPSVKKNELVNCDKVGIRAQLVDTRHMRLVMDFVIEDGADSTHILNAVSPAFTASFAFAQLVVDRIFKGGHALCV